MTQSVPGLYTGTVHVVTSSPSVTQAATLSDAAVQHRGKAPPIDAFTREDAEIRFDDWLPTLERAATWNNWAESEALMQFVGYVFTW